MAGHPTTRRTFLPFSPPAIGPEEIAEVTDTLHSEWITTGPKTAAFEAAFADAIGAEAALAVSSATAALQIALAVLDVQPGDEVITTPMTFCSTVHVIEQHGAVPVLVDVDPVTLCIDPEHIARALTRRTRAVLPVHLYGHPCEMDAILDLAERHALSVIEDAAHAIPAAYRGRRIGTIGTATAFSFYATKNMTTAEGGMLTGSRELMQRARPWSQHGISRDTFTRRYSAGGDWRYDVILPGFKCNMTDIQAALGLQQLRKVGGFHARRREIAARYNAAFGLLDTLETPKEQPWAESAWHLYPLRLNLDRLSVDRDRFIEELNLRNIAASVHFIPVHLHTYYRQRYRFAPSDFPVAYREFLRLVSLPLHPRLSDEDVADVIVAVGEIVSQFRR